MRRRDERRAGLFGKGAVSGKLILELTSVRPMTPRDLPNYRADRGGGGTSLAFSVTFLEGVNLVACYIGATTFCET